MSHRIYTADSDFKKNQLVHAVEPVTFQWTALLSTLEAKAVTDSHCWSQKFEVICGSPLLQFLSQDYLVESN